MKEEERHRIAKHIEGKAFNVKKLESYFKKNLHKIKSNCH